jgi:cytochrome c peroxidase
MLWNGQFGAAGLNLGTEGQWTIGTPKEFNTLGFLGLETQAIAGLHVHRMGLDSIWKYIEYIQLFDQAFPEILPVERYSMINAGLAIAAFERTILANRAPFQMWLKGNRAAMSDEEKEGAIIYFTSGGCHQCHTGPALNSDAFFCMGMDDLKGPGVYGSAPDQSTEQGRGGFTGLQDDMFKFKVPQLYNLVDAPFYGHGGSFRDIRSLIEYMNEGKPQKSGIPSESFAAEFEPLGLSEVEMDQLTAFIERGLYDPDLMRYEPASIISGQCFPNNDIISKLDLGCF